mmetsp:Transcript_25199/g.57968  ORF Transcript_25199/g.57968 Transcript_25199/m.57968 type:complete len:248 (-) Transcript_25199:59-802(-)
MSTAHYGRAVPVALRRFPKIQCHKLRLPEVVPESVGSEKDGSHQLLLPRGLQDGVHVILLLNRLRQIESADSWLSVREALERHLVEQQLHNEGELQMYICCLLPYFWPLRWLWRWRMQVWDDLLGSEHPAVHIMWSTDWSTSTYDRLGVHNDGRAYALVIRKNGEILWASHDKFKENKHQRLMVKVVREEVQWRTDERAKLLEAGASGALPSGAEVKDAASMPQGEPSLEKGSPPSEALAAEKAEPK